MLSYFTAIRCAFPTQCVKFNSLSIGLALRFAFNIIYIADRLFINIYNTRIQPYRYKRDTLQDRIELHHSTEKKYPSRYMKMMNDGSAAAMRFIRQTLAILRLDTDTVVRLHYI